MENASEALKMAGAMLIFVMALTITIISFTAARQASDSIVSTYGQLTTFYDYELYQNTGSYREVNSDEIVANLYSYYQTNNTILFYYLKSGSYSTSTKTFAPGSEIARMTLYYTPTSSTVPYTDKQQGKLSNLNKSFLRTKKHTTIPATITKKRNIEMITRAIVNLFLLGEIFSGNLISSSSISFNLYSGSSSIYLN